MRWITRIISGNMRGHHWVRQSFREGIRRVRIFGNYLVASLLWYVSVWRNGIFIMMRLMKRYLRGRRRIIRRCILRIGRMMCRLPDRWCISFLMLMMRYWCLIWRIWIHINCVSWLRKSRMDSCMSSFGGATIGMVMIKYNIFWKHRMNWILSMKLWSNIIVIDCIRIYSSSKKYQYL